MLRLHLPQPMPHALPRDRPLDFYSPSRSLKLDTASSMQLPAPRSNSGFERDAFSRQPLTSFDSSLSNLPSVRTSNSHSSDRRPLDYGYQLPAIGNQSRVNPSRSPTPQSQASHQSQDMNLQQQQQRQQQQQTSRNGSVSELSIPSSIKTPQESLAQLAAEVTCLFWFENSSTLKQALQSNSPHPTQPLVRDAIPTSGFKKWVATILVTTQVASNVILLALLFIYRLKKTNPTVKGKPGSEYRLLTVALMLGNKFLDDNTYTNKTWAEVTGISVQEVHIMEVEFLSNMRYSLFTSQKDWEEWHVTLGKFGTFYDRASRVMAPSAISPVGPPTTSLQVPPQFKTSPPVSQYSPPKAMTFPPLYQPQLSAPPTLQPPANVMPSVPTHPGLGPLGQRKRSSDEGTEPPAKRIAHGIAPGPYNHAPLIPSLQMPTTRNGSQSSVNRLPPLPTLSIPAPQQNPPVQVSNWSDLSLPAPGSRSMAMVYPTTTQWGQNLMTPTSTAAPSYSTSRTPTAGDRSRQASPFPMSAGSSPVSATYQSNQRQLSPSYFLSQRSSPYRPVCGVQTLLVPPPSTALHNAPNNVRYDQMQYQPLGRPTTERRAGPLPQHNPPQSWSETSSYYGFASGQGLPSVQGPPTVQ